MKRHPMTDKNGKVLMRKDGVTPRQELAIAIAIPKTGQDWKQTDWGQYIHSAGVTGWPDGEHQAPTFAWKITDGDSTIPNKNGKRPADRDGWAGHWVMWAKTEFDSGVKCYNAGDYTNQIMDPAAIKTGDYCRVQVGSTGNKPSESPGVYINPHLFELSRAGAAIAVNEGPSAEEAFGGSTAVLPADGQYDAAVAPVVPSIPTTPAAPTAPTIAPATDFLTPPAAPVDQMWLVDGVAHPESVLRNANYTDAHFATMQKA
jgi:hypothetical protein